MTDWQPIETAPKDGRPFLTWQDDEIYIAKYLGDGRLCYRGHSLFVGESYRIYQVRHEGHMVDAKVATNLPWQESFEHSWLLWQRGFDFRPTHWYPFPQGPSTQDEKERVA